MEVEVGEDDCKRKEHTRTTRCIIRRIRSIYNFIYSKLQPCCFLCFDCLDRDLSYLAVSVLVFFSFDKNHNVPTSLNSFCIDDYQFIFCFLTTYGFY